ncbi:MAG: hypothetical protein WC525_10380 [Candidatus Thermoplasmatota archaeon]
MPKTKKFKFLEIVMELSNFHDNKPEAFLYLGDIPNMPGHCAVVDREGKVRWGVHPEDFREATEEEV